MTKHSLSMFPFRKRRDPKWSIESNTKYTVSQMASYKTISRTTQLNAFGIESLIKFEQSNVLHVTFAYTDLSHKLYFVL